MIAAGYLFDENDSLVDETKYLSSYLQNDPIDFSKLNDKPITPDEFELIKAFRETNSEPTPEEIKGLKAMIKAYMQNLKEEKNKPFLGVHL